jgi:hypothetical protein
MDVNWELCKERVVIFASAIIRRVAVNAEWSVRMNAREIAIWFVTWGAACCLAQGC